MDQVGDISPQDPLSMLSLVAAVFSTPASPSQEGCRARRLRCAIFCRPAGRSGSALPSAELHEPQNLRTNILASLERFPQRVHQKGLVCRRDNSPNPTGSLSWSAARTLSCKENRPPSRGRQEPFSTAQGNPRAACAVHNALKYGQFSGVRNFFLGCGKNCEFSAPRSRFSRIPPQGRPDAPPPPCGKRPHRAKKSGQRGSPRVVLPAPTTL